MAKQTTGIASINMRQLRNCPVFLPPIELQEQYAELCTGAASLETALSQRFDVTDDLFNSLVQRAFRGEL